MIENDKKKMTTYRVLLLVALLARAKHCDGDAAEAVFSCRFAGFTSPCESNGSVSKTPLCTRRFSVSTSSSPCIVQLVTWMLCRAAVFERGLCCLAFRFFIVCRLFSSFDNFLAFCFSCVCRFPDSPWLRVAVLVNLCLSVYCVAKEEREAKGERELEVWVWPLL